MAAAAISWLLPLCCLTLEPLAAGEVPLATTCAPAAAQDAMEIRLAGASNSGSRAAQALNGVRLAVDAINAMNASHAFKTRGDAAIIAANLWMFEADSADSVRELYATLMASGSYDFFLGPFSSGLSLGAAQEAAAAGQLIMMTTEEDPLVYEQGFPGVFSPGFHPLNMTADLLVTLREQGANTFAMLRSPSAAAGASGAAAGRRAAAVCDGAWEQARQLGYNMSSRTSSSAKNVAADIRWISEQQPDVWLTCGSPDEEIVVALTADALSVRPGAAIFSSAGDPQFSDALSSTAVAHSLGPAPWHPGHPRSACRVFGSAGDFATKYRREFEAEPTWESAQAAAAVVALFHAVEAAEHTAGLDGTGLCLRSPAKVRDAFLEINISTFFGRLTWDPTRGTRSAGDSLGVQWQAASTGEMTSALAVPPVHGLVYPRTEQCVASGSDNAWEGEFRECEPCPPGTYREADYYNSWLSQQQACKPCLNGMNCSTGPSVSDPAPFSLPGWYGITSDDGGSFSYHGCLPPDLCTGGTTCRAHSTGFFCSECEEGYTRWGVLEHLHCHKCPGIQVPLIMAVIVALLYVGFVWVLKWCADISARSLTSLHSPVIRVVINYCVFTAAALKASDLTDFGAFQIPLRLFEDMMLSPLQSWVIFDCLLSGTGLRPHHFSGAVAVFLLPIVILLEYALYGAVVQVATLRHRGQLSSEEANVPQGLAGRLRATRTRSKERSDTDGASWQSPEEEDDGRVPFDLLGLRPPERVTSNVTPSGQSGTPGTPGNRTPARRSYSQSRQVSFATDNDSSAEGGGGLVRAPTELPANQPSVAAIHYFRGQTVNLWQQDSGDSTDDAAILDEVETRRVQSAVIWTVLLYPVALKMVLINLTCKELDKLRLEANLETACKPGGPEGWGFIWGGVFFWIVFFTGPFWALVALRSLPETGFQDLRTRRRWGFMFDGYKERCYYYEALGFLRKGVVVGATAMPNQIARLFLMVILGFVFMTLHLWCRPFDARQFWALDEMETMMLLSFVAIVGARLVDRLHTMAPTETWNETGWAGEFWLNVVLFCITAAFHLRFLGLAFYSLMRNVFINQLQFEAECLPDNGGLLSKCILQLEAPRSHKMRMNWLTSELNITELTPFEKELFYDAIAETLRNYMMATAAGFPKKFSDSLQQTPEGPATLYLGYLTCAVEIAFTQCEDARILRAQEVLTHRPNMLHSWLRWAIGLAEVDLDDLRAEEQGATTPTTPERVAAMGATVEELQAALIRSWPLIRAGHESYFEFIRDEENESEGQDREVEEWGAKDSINALLTHIDKRSKAIDKRARRSSLSQEMLSFSGDQTTSGRSGRGSSADLTSSPGRSRQDQQGSSGGSRGASARSQPPNSTAPPFQDFLGLQSSQHRDTADRESQPQHEQLFQEVLQLRKEAAQLRARVQANPPPATPSAYHESDQ